MIIYCKICDLPLQHHTGSSYRWSDQCVKGHYSVRYTYQQHLEMEVVIAGNYCLLFIPAHQMAYVCKDINQSFPALKSFYLAELTPEIAQHWLGKLKTYMLLQ